MYKLNMRNLNRSKKSVNTQQRSYSGSCRRQLASTMAFPAQSASCAASCAARTRDCVTYLNCKDLPEDFANITEIIVMSMHDDNGS